MCYASSLTSWPPWSPLVFTVNLTRASACLYVMPLNLAFVKKNQKIKVSLWEEPRHPHLPSVTFSRLRSRTPHFTPPQPSLDLTPPLSACPPPLKSCTVQMLWDSTPRGFSLRTNFSGRSSEAPGCTDSCALDQQITFIPIWGARLYVFRQLRVFLVERSSGCRLYIQDAMVPNTNKNVPSLLCLRAAVSVPLSSWLQAPWIQNLQQRVGTPVPRLFVLMLVRTCFHEHTAWTFSFNLPNLIHIASLCSETVDKHATVCKWRFLSLSIFDLLFYFTPKAFNSDGKIPAGSSVGVVESFS